MMLKTPQPNNPWFEDPEQLPGQGIAKLAKLNTAIGHNQAVLSAKTKKLPSQAKTVISALEGNDLIYRNNRHLFVQQIPTFIKLTHALANATANSDKSAEVKSVRQKLTNDVLTATDHLSAEFSAISSGATVQEMEDARLSWDTLPGIAKDAMNAAQATRNNPVDALRNLATSAGTTMTDVASSTASTVSSITCEAGSRINAAAKLARITSSTALTAVKSRTLDHAALYGGAALKTIWVTGGLALIVGLVTVVVFSTPAPYVAGLTVFTAPDTFAKILAADMPEAERERALRNAGAKEELIAAWNELKGQRIIRIDTPYITTDLDVVEKHMDGTILAGKYAGQRLSQLDRETILSLEQHAPDNETRELLSKYLTDQKPLVTAQQESSPPKDSAPAGLIGIGLEALFATEVA